MSRRVSLLARCHGRAISCPYSFPGIRREAEARDITIAASLRRLGELYESKGNRPKALEYYGRFVDLWKNADPELQALVKDVRRQMAELEKAAGRR